MFSGVFLIWNATFTTNIEYSLIHPMNIFKYLLIPRLSCIPKVMFLKSIKCTGTGIF